MFKFFQSPQKSVYSNQSPVSFNQEHSPTIPHSTILFHCIDESQSSCRWSHSQDLCNLIVRGDNFFRNIANEKYYTPTSDFFLTLHYF